MEEEELRKKLKHGIKNFFPGYKPSQTVFKQPTISAAPQSDKIDSLLINTPERLNLIKSWLGFECTFKLLYRGTKNGFKGAKFHFLVDKKGPNLTIFKSNNQFIFGGYTKVQQYTPPAFNPTFDSDPEAFIFNLHPHKTKHPCVKNQDKAVGRGKQRFACFGRTEIHETETTDLEVFDDCDTYGNNTANLGKCYALPESLTYGSLDARKYLAGTSTFKVLECEVFQIKPIA